MGLIGDVERGKVVADSWGLLGIGCVHGIHGMGSGLVWWVVKVAMAREVVMNDKGVMARVLW